MKIYGWHRKWEQPSDHVKLATDWSDTWGSVPISWQNYTYPPPPPSQKLAFFINWNDVIQWMTERPQMFAIYKVNPFLSWIHAPEKLSSQSWRYYLVCLTFILSFTKAGRVVKLCMLCLGCTKPKPGGGFQSFCSSCKNDSNEGHVQPAKLAQWCTTFTKYYNAHAFSVKPLFEKHYILLLSGFRANLEHIAKIRAKNLPLCRTSNLSKMLRSPNIPKKKLSFFKPYIGVLSNRNSRLFCRFSAHGKMEKNTIAAKTMNTCLICATN